ncbi:MAG: hypothetical protein WBV61_05610 [Rhodanobacteraceae bacterium]
MIHHAAFPAESRRQVGALCSMDSHGRLRECTPGLQRDHHAACLGGVAFGPYRSNRKAMCRHDGVYTA